MRRFLLISGLIFSSIFLYSGFGMAQNVPYQDGETLRYNIRKFGVKAGEAVIVYHGFVEEDGKQCILITFTARAFNFLDDERVFADPETLLPIKVERDLNIFGKKEKIVEHYDLKKNMVTIRKYQNQKFLEEIAFQKENPIDNLYCYIFRYRKSGDFVLGKKLRMYLPTKDVDLEIVRQDRINALGSSQAAWFMKSRPSEYQVWFSTNSEKVPLRIDGSIGLAKTSMVLESYQKGKIE